MGSDQRLPQPPGPRRAGPGPVAQRGLSHRLRRVRPERRSLATAHHRHLAFPVPRAMTMGGPLSERPGIPPDGPEPDWHHIADALWLAATIGERAGAPG